MIKMRFVVVSPSSASFFSSPFRSVMVAAVVVIRIAVVHIVLSAAAAAAATATSIVVSPLFFVPVQAFVLGFTSTTPHHAYYRASSSSSASSATAAAATLPIPIPIPLSIPITALLNGYLDSLSSSSDDNNDDDNTGNNEVEEVEEDDSTKNPNEEDPNPPAQRHPHPHPPFSSSLPPRQTKQRGPSSSSSRSGGGGGSIPCGRGPLGSYLDGMDATRTTANAEDGEEEAANNNDNDDDDDDDDDPVFLSRHAIQQYKAAMSTIQNLDTYLSASSSSKSSSSSSSSSNMDVTDPTFYFPEDARTDIRNLLTQRALQHFMKLCDDCRDPHTVSWLNAYLLHPTTVTATAVEHHQQSSIMNYYGTGSKFLEEHFAGRWDVPLLELTQRPSETLIISSKRRGRGHGGWSKQNPYLQERWVETTVTVTPSNLATRIVAVREQLAQLWSTQDLPQIINRNVETALVEFLTETTRTTKTTNTATDGSCSTGSTNYELIYNLCTQAAIHRLLRENQERTPNNPWVPMFRDFYTEVAGEYFDGEVSPVYDNSYGYAADAFIAKLIVTLANIPFVFNAATAWSPIRGELTTPPPNSAHVAKLILIKRQEVAHDWKVLLEQVPVDHTPIRQLLIAHQYQQSSSSSSSIATLLPSEDTNTNNTNHNKDDDDHGETFSVFQ